MEGPGTGRSTGGDGDRGGRTSISITSTNPVPSSTPWGFMGAVREPPTPTSFRLPWSTCVMGCGLTGGEEVVLLDCFHVICSRRCATVGHGGNPDAAPAPTLKCPRCSAMVDRNHLSRKVILEKEFVRKGVPKANCDNCIFDRVAIAYCPECPNYLCEQCAEIHPQLRASCNHVLNFNLTDDAPRGGPDGVPNQCEGHPGEELSHACVTCKVKLCGKCLEEGEGHRKEHEVVHIQKEKRKLEEKIQAARQLIDAYGKAKTELQTKREDIINYEWVTISEEVGNQISTMVQILHFRVHELIKETRDVFRDKFCSLKAKEELSGVVKAAAEEFAGTGELLLKEMDDLTVANYMRHGKGWIQWLAKMEEVIARDYDNFIEKDYHFVMDSATNKLALEYLQKCCRVEYVHKPRVPGPIAEATSEE